MLAHLRMWIGCSFLLVVVSAASLAVTARAEEPQAWAKAHLEELVELYRHFHAHPELSFQEKETAARLAKELRAAGAEVTENVGGTGVVGILKNGAGRAVMLRTDLDALPVTEQTGLVYASQVKVKGEAGETGVMHACGHDIHITNLIAVARWFAANKDAWKGTLIFLGQPAEERGSGARAMLEDGLFEKFPKPDYAVALHCDSSLATGKVGVRGGYALANVDSVDITLLGKGGHGAYPHTTIDPIVMAAQLVLSLQTIVSREIKPIEPCVITVGSIHGGTKHNIIGADCHLQITVRSYSDEVRQQLHDAIVRKAKGVAVGAGAPEPKIVFSEGTPAMFNDEKLAGRLREVFVRELGTANIDDPEPSMGGEDFSEYGRAGVPILMFRLGTIEPARLARMKQLGQEMPSLHSPLYYPDAEPTLVTGLQTTVAAARELLKK
ncbi:MAG TPA: amidohydrolase [Pirellulaceae bacterium]|nr:amidohydrolase [Pirellulaceae bacterium]